jgi:hypothetical protein
LEESLSVKEIYVQHIMPLSVVPALAQFCRKVFLDEASLLPSLLSALLLYGLIFAFPALTALFIEKLSFFFEGRTTPANALKLASYSVSPWCIFGMLQMAPDPAPELEKLLSFYCLYVFYTGIPETTNIPEDRNFAFFFTTLAGALAIILFNSGIMSTLPI